MAVIQEVHLDGFRINHALNRKGLSLFESEPRLFAYPIR